jgi:hypothetical protein
LFWEPQLIDDFPFDFATTLAARAASPAGAREFDRLACDFRSAAAAHGLGSPAAALAPPPSALALCGPAPPGWLPGAATDKRRRICPPGGAVEAGRAMAAPLCAAAASAANGRRARAVCLRAGERVASRPAQPPTQQPLAVVPGGGAAGGSGPSSTLQPWVPKPLPVADTTAHAASPQTADAALAAAGADAAGGGAGAAAGTSASVSETRIGMGLDAWGGSGLWALTRLLPPK